MIQHDLTRYCLTTNGQAMDKLYALRLRRSEVSRSRRMAAQPTGASSLRRFETLCHV
jgi:hypothetical protein